MSVTPEHRSEHKAGTATTDQRSIGDLLKELRDETTVLFRQEIALAKQETSEKINKTVTNIGTMASGGMIAYAGFLFVLAAAAAGVTVLLEYAGLGAEITVWLGPLIVGGVVLIIGGIMMAGAKKSIKNTSLRPERTIESIKEDKQWAKQKIK